MQKKNQNKNKTKQKNFYFWGKQDRTYGAYLRILSLLQNLCRSLECYS